jgi:hypothetical protein
VPWLLLEIAVRASWPAEHRGRVDRALTNKVAHTAWIGHVTAHQQPGILVAASLSHLGVAGRCRPVCRRAVGDRSHVDETHVKVA